MTGSRLQTALRRPNAQTLAELLRLPDFGPIYQEADRIRREQVGDTVHLRAILEFSNICRRRCRYCGLNAENTAAPRYRMREDEILSTARQAAEAGYRTLVMQSGEDPYYTPERLGGLIREIRKTGMTVTVSCGEMEESAYAHLRDCGADRYLLKHETADPQLYSRLHPCGTLEHRVDCLRTLKRLGYETGGGFMVGLPGQTLETIGQDLLLLRDIPCDMAGIGPFIAHPRTPLKDSPSGSAELTRRAVALARLLLPKAHLPATTALGVLNAGVKNDVFSCGANVVMRKVTPDAYKKKYDIYPAALPPTEIGSGRRELEEQIRALGRIPE
ncbi:MAG: [FeFe] hydrogenase H-cluster radical SAM maturase HydE [Clostridiales bacterium]|nr:[FeFe] hydrogenase H-cluster radical SAM maturase HydE [Clostridiales bacterium]